MNELNQEQMSAVLCEDKKVLCLAGAGTGKTHTMLARISHLVDQGTDPSSILVLTFTNAAAFEMKDRYQRKHRSGLIPEFRTFHSFCYSLLSSDRDIRLHLGYTLTPIIADDSIKKRIIREAGSMTNIKSSLESLAKKKNRTAKEQYEYDMLKKTTARLMQKRNTITFDELCQSICDLFTNDSPLVEKYKSRYKFIFVDEFQDTDPVQYDFVKSFKDSKLFVIGDALQALYSFRGADSTIIKDLSVDLEWRTIKFTKNYRSPKTICEFANEHSKYADPNYRIALQSGKNEEGEWVTERLYSGFVPYGSVSEDILDNCIQDIQTHSGSTAVICRTNKEVAFIQNEFKSRGLEFRSAKKTADVANILSSVGDNQHLIDWLSSYLNAERYSDFIRAEALASDKNEEYGIIKFIEDFGDAFAVGERWNTVKTIRRICKETDRSVYDRCKDIAELLNFPMSIDESRCTDMKLSLDYLSELYQGDEEKPGSDVYIGTIHSVKGLEFDNVYVINVDGSTFQLEGEDNNNLYYVAITRAKKHLVVYRKDW